MRVFIVGAGPAGLFFATLLKNQDTRHEVVVAEQQPAGQTDGFGICLSKAALANLDAASPSLRVGLEATAERLDTLTINHRADRVVIHNKPIVAISRADLVERLRTEAVRRGVRIVDGRRVDALPAAGDVDLIVGADGANSTVRTLLREGFAPTIRACANHWIWYGTTRTSDGIELIFKSTAAGLFIGHTYRYSADRNSFVVEVEPDAWRAAGLDGMSADDGQRFCEAVFDDVLRGAPLLSKRSRWFRPTIITCANWTAGNATLLGDALKTTHPSIGSGTKAALDDAIDLAAACRAHPDSVPAALAAFERARRPSADRIQEAAVRSVDWYETLGHRLHLSATDLAYEYMTRSGRIDPNRLWEIDPEFMRSRGACVPHGPRTIDPGQTLRA